jgi:hypothetical protein
LVENIGDDYIDLSKTDYDGAYDEASDEYK